MDELLAQLNEPGQERGGGVLLAPLDGIRKQMLRLMYFVTDMEAAADVVDNQLIELAQKKHHLKVNFSDDGWKDLEEIASAVLQVSQMSIACFQTMDKDLAALGQKIYRGGNSATTVAACAGCHGPSGAGMPAQYPRISGQFAEYVEVQLKAFRSGARANDPNGMMRGVAARMTDREIQAVAEYVAGLR